MQRAGDKSEALLRGTVFVDVARTADSFQVYEDFKGYPDICRSLYEITRRLVCGVDLPVRE